MIHIYDGNNFFRRLIEKDPRPVSTIYTMSCAMAATHLWVWDGLGGNFKRRKIFPDYKMQRSKTEESIRETMVIVKDVISHSRSTQVELNDYEADDVIAHLALDFADKGADVMVDTSDYDMVQLAQHPKIRTTVKVKDHIPADKVRLYKTWVGDPSDNIPGVVGFGATTWLQQMNNPDLMKMIGNAVSEKWDPELATKTFTSRQARSNPGWRWSR